MSVTDCYGRDVVMTATRKKRFTVRCTCNNEILHRNIIMRGRGHSDVIKNAEWKFIKNGPLILSESSRRAVLLYCRRRPARAFDGAVARTVLIPITSEIREQNGISIRIPRVQYYNTVSAKLDVPNYLRCNTRRL